MDILKPFIGLLLKNFWLWFVSQFGTKTCEMGTKVNPFGCKGLKSDSDLPKKCFLLQWKPFKNNGKCFLVHVKSSFGKFLSWRFGYVEKRLDKKAKVNNMEIYVVTNWTTNNCSTYIAQ